jgi:hypothetical protein
MAFVAVYDASVLYPSTTRDILIRIAQAGLVQAKWTDAILDEVFTGLACTAEMRSSSKSAGRMSWLIERYPSSPISRLRRLSADSVSTGQTPTDSCHEEAACTKNVRASVGRRCATATATVPSWWSPGSPGSQVRAMGEFDDHPEGLPGQGSRPARVVDG